jgi:hypothetical protein
MESVQQKILFPSFGGLLLDGVGCNGLAFLGGMADIW